MARNDSTTADGRVVVCFKNAGTFNLRYSTLEFQDAAHPGGGEIWPVSFALPAWSAAVERQGAELVKTSVRPR